MSESTTPFTESDISSTVTESSTRFSSSTEFESSSPSPSSSGRSSPVSSSLILSTVAPSAESSATEGTSTFLPATSIPAVITSSFDTTSTPSTTAVIHPVQNTTHTSESGLSKAKIVAIAVSAGAGGLLIAALLFLLVWRIRRASSKRHNKAPSQNVDAETMEKFARPPEYRQLDDGIDSPGKETKLSMPFARTSFEESRRSSRFSAEFAQYKDSPPSPFVNDEVEASHEPLTHAISLADATPFIHYMDEIQLEAVPGPLPNPHPEPRRAAQQLPPLIITSQAVLSTRRPTKGKRVSRRGSNHGYRAVDTGEQSDADSESMYSQASAYSVGFPIDNVEDTTSAVRRIPLSAPPAIREKRERHASESTIRPGDNARGSAFSDVTEAEAEPQRTDVENAMALLVREQERDIGGPPSEHDTDTTGALSPENSVLVAQLLMSRGKSRKSPARSDSVVSHIERKDSIRPAERRSVGPLRVSISRKTHAPGSAAREGE